jgi:hypothetical protein
MRGQTDLGRAVDERIAARGAELELRHGTGAPPDSTVEGGSIWGGGGNPAGGPAFPEYFVESLRLTNAGTRRSGNIVLRHSGVGGLAEDTAASGDRRFSWQGASAEPVASLPGTPDADTIYRRTTDGTLWWHDGAAWIELGQRTAQRQVYWAAGNADGGSADINLHWATESVIPLATVPAVSGASRCAFSAQQDAAAGYLSDGYARFSWAPTSQGPSVDQQAKLLAGVPCRKFGAAAGVLARLRLNTGGGHSTFAGLYLALSDDGANQSATGNQISAITANTWAELALGPVDISGWSDYLRLTVTAAGTTVAADAGPCVVDIEYLAIEQWAG